MRSRPTLTRGGRVAAWSANPGDAVAAHADRGGRGSAGEQGRWPAARLSDTGQAGDYRHIWA